MMVQQYLIDAWLKTTVFYGTSYIALTVSVHAVMGYSTTFVFKLT